MCGLARATGVLRTVAGQNPMHATRAKTIGVAASARWRQFIQPALQISLLRLLPRESERPEVTGSGFIRSPQPTAKVGPGRMREMVIGEVATSQDRVDQCQALGRPVAHRHRHRPVEFDHGRGL